MMTEMTGACISVTSFPLRIKRSPKDPMGCRVSVIGSERGVDRRLRHGVPDPYCQFRPLDGTRDVVHVDVTAELSCVFLRDLPGAVPGCKKNLLATDGPRRIECSERSV